MMRFPYQVYQSIVADESVAFVLDRGLAQVEFYSPFPRGEPDDVESLGTPPQAQFGIQSLHGTFLAPGQSSVGALRREDYHAMWGISIGAGGTICLRGTVKGQYLWALEDRKGITMMPLCIEHSQLQPLILSRSGHTEDDYDMIDVVRLLELERADGGVEGDGLRLRGDDESADDDADSGESDGDGETSSATGGDDLGQLSQAQGKSVSATGVATVNYTSLLPEEVFSRIKENG